MEGSAPIPRLFWASKPSLYLEDENKFQKSSSIVQIPNQSPNVPRRPIFDPPQNKITFFVAQGFSSRPVGVGKLFVWDPAIQTGSKSVFKQTDGFQIPLVL
jgi:hypothetical protein